MLLSYRVNDIIYDLFQWHPPLGVNATKVNNLEQAVTVSVFQWAPTLGGECCLAIWVSVTC